MTILASETTFLLYRRLPLLSSKQQASAHFQPNHVKICTEHEKADEPEAKGPTTWAKLCDHYRVEKTSFSNKWPGLCWDLRRIGNNCSFDLFPTRTQKGMLDGAWRALALGRRPVQARWLPRESQADSGLEWRAPRQHVNHRPHMDQKSQ